MKWLIPKTSQLTVRLMHSDISLQIWNFFVMLFTLFVLGPEITILIIVRWYWNTLYSYFAVN